MSHKMRAKRANIPIFAPELKKSFLARKFKQLLASLAMLQNETFSLIFKQCVLRDDCILKVWLAAAGEPTAA